MTYELAIELWKSGFRLPVSSSLVGRWKTEDGHVYTGGEEFHYIIPTLEELIEACGDELFYLRNDGSSKWIAKQKALVDDFVPYSSTPAEAVARLWLALNKNESK